VSGPTAALAALEAREVTKRFGAVLALDGVSISVGAGETVALVGESGSGKTTLLRSFNGMVAPDDGSVFVDGRSLDDADLVQLRRALGYVQQEGGLLPHWTVLRNAGLVPRLRKEPDAAERAREALELVGLDPDTFGSRWPRELSGGQRQRVALARAIAARPRIILLDEPFGAVDAITRSELQTAFAALVERLGVTVLLVTHDLREAFLLADRVAVMQGGRIEQLADADTLVRGPETPYVAELLAKAGVA
jgi:osmoprotectant transport system ATP-binding protein